MDTNTATTVNVEQTSEVGQYGAEVLDQSGLSADLIAKMKAATAVSEIRCYQHPESPTGYIGRGHWCEHKRAQLASR